MTTIKLDNDLQFSIERDDKHARLIVYKDDVENVCLKETTGVPEKLTGRPIKTYWKG